MRRHVGTLGHEAHVAQRAGADDGPETRALDRVELAGFATVDQVEQPRKAVAQVEAAAAAVTDIEDALEFLVERFAIVKIISLPGDRMSCWGFEAALAMIGRFAHGRMQVPDATPATQE